MAFTKFSRKTKIAAVAGALMLGGGTAFAYWSITSTGSGSATNAEKSGTITLAATFSDGMAPGDSRTVTYKATNSGGTSSLRVGTITSTVQIDETHAAAGCVASYFSIAPFDANQIVDANSTKTLGTNTLTFNDSAATNQDACKGATVTLALAGN